MSEKPKRIFISNRLPFNITADGELKRGSGGLVSALLGVSLDEPFAWFGFDTDKDEAERLQNKVREAHPHLQSYPVYISKERYEKYYDGFSNEIIWPLFHYESQLTGFIRENWEAYKEANQIMAHEIVKVATDKDTIWIHDFHFLLLPKMIRERLPGVKIGFFLHIPFPSAELFRQLPVREELLSAMLHSDLIGFHEHSYLRQFTVSLKSILGLDTSFFKADLNGHTAHLGVYPISIESDAYKAKASSPEVQQKCDYYASVSNVPFTLLGVDRLDYTKGLVLKLRGLHRAFTKYPELIGKISLLQIAVPTRENVPAYMDLKKEIEQLVGSINGQFGTPEYIPVHYIFKSISEVELLALYRSSNAALVTSKRDGMNLVAMEYVMAQDLETPGSLILSEFAGASSMLSDALIVNPWDVDAIADAIKQAFEMSFEERYERLSHLQEILSRYSSTKWALAFLKDLEQITQISSKKVVDIQAPPESWPKPLHKALQTRKMKVVLDYDGTVVALAKRPELATLLEETKHLLLSLHEKMEVFVISGRSKEFLESQFVDMPIGLAAEHGAYFKFPGEAWQSRIASEIQAWYPQIEKVMNDYSDRVPLAWVEKKSASLVWHFRQSPADFANFQAKKLHDELQIGMANEPVSIAMGSNIVEAKAIECNKGSFLRWLLQLGNTDAGSIICIGDDRTDEDMFRALGDTGFSIKVGPGITEAHYRLRNQKEVIAFLHELVIAKASIVASKHFEQRRENDATY
ncbi:bifunctional alpha,alpha-trehalose-phosphate synthase (UDP-forming)/trehalose-phosphatase [Bdellovibrio bacteriovorus]|uniref:bifunctional alpha,alpha-trehalose-phosphate synthase (UDP-forming)/trehalose-phosphatase n=1 Tax=Bdellovibrio bacteriovorus TaxID=959 RepID=UPI0035A70539